MDGSGVSYADHDVHHIRHSVQWRSDADSGPSDTIEDIQQFDITERGLDPDELAELRAMRVTLFTLTTTTVNQGLPGTVVARIGAGYNLTGDEFLLSEADSTRIDTDDSGTDDFIVRTNDTDEVGQVYHATVQETVNFGDGTNGVGGAANDSMPSELLNMAELFGSGPFVDSADDFSSRIFLAVNDVLESVEIGISYSLYYDVNEVEGGRSRFGR